MRCCAQAGKQCRVQRRLGVGTQMRQEGGFWSFWRVVPIMFAVFRRVCLQIAAKLPHQFQQVLVCLFSVWGLLSVFSVKCLSWNTPANPRDIISRFAPERSYRGRKT